MSAKLNKLFAKKDAAKKHGSSDEPKRVIQETAVDEGEFGITGDLNPEVATIVLSKTDGATIHDTKALPRAGAKHEEPKVAKQWKTKEELDAEKDMPAEEPKEEVKEEAKPATTGTYRVGALGRGSGAGRGRGASDKANPNLNSNEEFPTLAVAATHKDDDKEKSEPAPAPVTSNAWAARGR